MKTVEYNLSFGSKLLWLYRLDTGLFCCLKRASHIA